MFFPPLGLICFLLLFLYGIHTEGWLWCVFFFLNKMFPSCLCCIYYIPYTVYNIFFPAFEASPFHVIKYAFRFLDHFTCVCEEVIHWCSGQKKLWPLGTIMPLHTVTPYKAVFIVCLVTAEVTVDSQMLPSNFSSVLWNKEFNILLGWSRSVLNCNLLLY